MDTETWVSKESWPWRRQLFLIKSPALTSFYLQSLCPWHCTKVFWHHTINRLQERGVERGSTRRSSFERTREGHAIKWTLELFQRRRWGNFWETGWSAYGLFWALRYLPSWTELSWTVLAWPTTKAVYRLSRHATWIWFRCSNSRQYVNFFTGVWSVLIQLVLALC